MNTRYLEKDGPVMDREDFTISGDPSGPNYINMWRARLPGEPTGEPMPMLCATTTPPELMGDKYDEDKLNAEHRTDIWFKDREGWKAAFRLARHIAKGRRINTRSMSANIFVQYAPRHWDEDPANDLPGIVQDALIAGQYRKALHLWIDTTFKDEQACLTLLLAIHTFNLHSSIAGAV